ncbi:zinc-ribbon domain-containing protein [Mesobacillus selenatarsenatis]|uniref:Zinc-ribbon domain-containing protein n=1 Tax=Mesobacillus selenatarsenatis TaxID=388741 RepID=A0A846T7R6_9BACI|nr:zinc-ribbon domain-containing protein [Mesobacillus selenatarsenatis]NKE04673.1 zinc-ribbon domain-containing protein [Mesobacillus selenatarsenatis]
MNWFDHLKSIFSVSKTEQKTSKQLDTEKVNITQDNQQDSIKGTAVCYEDYQSNYVAFDKWRCPSCEHQFEKEVTRKRKCPSCQNILLVRTHHQTKKKMILKEEQIAKLESEKEKYYKDKWIKDFFKRYGTTYEQEKANYSSGSPYPHDVAWGMLNRAAMENASRMQYGLYRNVRMDMGDLLKREGKTGRALLFYLEVCFLDINGATNTVNDPQLLKKYPPFQLDLAFIAPGILSYVETIMEELNMPLDKVKEEFIKHNRQIYEYNKLVPLPAERAWKTLESELKEREAEFNK